MLFSHTLTRYRASLAPFTLIALLLAASLLTLRAVAGGARTQTVGSQVYAQTLIIASDGEDGDVFGDAVALSGDLLAVGATDARLNGTPAGAVYLYERDPQSPTGWTEIHTIYGHPTPLISPDFGRAVALQGDTLVVGAPFDPGDNGNIRGLVHVYERNQGGPDNWGLVAELDDEIKADGRWFGRSVALDGDLVAVSAVGAESNRGKVYLYSRAAGWAHIKDFSDTGGQPFDWFGSALALHGDTLVVGAEQADLDATNTGAAFVYQRDHGGADQWGLVTRLQPHEPRFDSFFGGSLAFDGDTLVVGAYNEDRYENGQPTITQVGAAYVFGRNHGGPGAWGQIAALRHDALTLDRFGTSVAVSGDDLWVGAPNLDTGGFDDSDEGAVFHYRRDEGGPGAWGLVDAIHADPDSLDATFGSALAAEGQTLLAGAPYHELQGAAYVIVPGEPPDNADTVYLPLTFNYWMPPTGILEDGGSLESDSGAIVGAVPGTLDAPLLATIEETRSPAEPLPNGFVARGEYYHLAAKRLAIAPADKPLLVGLPVPNTADTTRLAAALYVPDSLTTEATFSDTQTRGWTTAPGSYDPVTNLFVITVRALMPEGVTLVLYEHPHNAPLPLPDDTARQPQGQIEYIVKCDPEAHHTGACTPANYRLVADQMEALHHEYVDTYGFKIPALPRSAGAFIEPDKEPVLYETAANVVIASKPCLNPEGEPISGYYAAYAAKLLICFDDPDDADQRYRTMRHELFHAVLASYPLVIDDFYDDYYRPRTHWLLEGTAAAAEFSGPAMFRSPAYDLRQVTTPLTSTLEEDAYQMQDFWVYVGREGGQPEHDISYLQPILEEGATPEHASKAMPLADDYWNWAKNQAIEHYQTMDGAFEAGPCELEQAAIDPALTNVLFYPEEIFVQGRIPPMTTALVEIVFTGNELPSNMPVTAENDTQEADMRHKVYVEGEQDCKDMGDDDRIVTNVSPTDKIYVLISNVSLTDPFNYILQVD